MRAPQGRHAATVAGLLTAGLVLGLGHSASAASATAGESLTVIEAAPLDDRLTQFTLLSPALGREVTVRVQLPTHYDTLGSRWPLALLLHGRSEDGTTWSDQIDLKPFDGMVIVTPDGGPVGWYTDWFDDSCCDAQRWESFHIDELLPWVASNFRLAPGRSQRFVAGDSMGGFGAMSYAARHPDLFGAAAELSGFVDLMLLESSGVIGVDGQTFQVAGTAPGSIFGPMPSEEVRWRGHNPVDLAANLASTDLVLRHGNGLPGQFGGDPDAGEAAIRLTGISFHDRLDSLGIAHQWDDYGNGVHTWPYWQWGLELTWPRWLAIAEAADDRVDRPSPFSYRSIEPNFTVYGWQVDLDRPALEFARFDDVSDAGFTLTGSGMAAVTTPPLFAPGTPVLVTINASPVIVVAGDDGRLQLDVDLGPGHTAQQYTPLADAQEAALGAGYFTTATVSMAAGHTLTTATDPSASASPLPATGGGLVPAALLVVACSWPTTFRRGRRLADTRGR